MQKQRLCLHAVAGSEVSVDEVLVAEVFHSPGNIGHELNQHLRWEVLQDNAERNKFCFCSLSNKADVYFLCNRGHQSPSCFKSEWSIPLLQILLMWKQYSSAPLCSWKLCMGVPILCMDLVLIRLVLPNFALQGLTV